jgi:hypothetical protein
MRTATGSSTPLHARHPTVPLPSSPQSMQTAAPCTAPPVNTAQSAQMMALQVAQLPAAGAWQCTQ